MSEAKTYVFGEQGNNLLSTLAPLLQNKGVDPNVLAMLNNNGGWGGNNGSWFIWILFLCLFGGWGNGGFGGWGNGGMNGAGFLSNQINNNEGRDLLMQAIQGNKDAIGNLAATLNTDFAQVSNAVNAINTQLCGIGKDIGMSSMQVINSLQQGNMQIAQQIANASAQSNLATCQQTSTLQNAIYDTRSGLQGSICDAKTTLNNTLTGLGFAGERQTCELKGVVRDQVDRVVAGQEAAVKQALLDKIDALREENSSMKSVAATSQIVNQAVSPLVGSLAALQNEFTAFKAAQPVTYPVQYQPFVAVPNGVAYAYGAAGNNGFWGA